MSVYVGLIACADRAGLVHEITGVLFRAKLNVTQNQEFVDHVNGRFFMRTQFEGTVASDALISDLQRVLPKGALCKVRELKPRKLVVLASEEPHCLGEILLRHLNRELNAEIAIVLSQLDACRDLTERFGLPYEFIPVKKDRAEHEARVLKAIEKHAPDYLVLARYMRIFSQDFVARFPEKIINIHHSFLPAFIGKDPYQQAYQRGVKIVGATSHFVTEELDQGPIITQDVIAVDHTCSPASMARLGQDVEKLVLMRGLNLVLEDRVLTDGNRTIVFA